MGWHCTSCNYLHNDIAHPVRCRSCGSHSVLHDTHGYQQQVPNFQSPYSQNQFQQSPYPQNQFQQSPYSQVGNFYSPLPQVPNVFQPQASGQIWPNTSFQASGTGFNPYQAPVNAGIYSAQNQFPPNAYAQVPPFGSVQTQMPQGMTQTMGSAAQGLNLPIQPHQPQFPARASEVQVPQAILSQQATQPITSAHNYSSQIVLCQAHLEALEQRLNDLEMGRGVVDPGPGVPSTALSDVDRGTKIKTADDSARQSPIGTPDQAKLGASCRSVSIPSAEATVVQSNAQTFVDATRFAQDLPLSKVSDGQSSELQTTEPLQFALQQCFSIPRMPEPRCSREHPRVWPEEFAPMSTRPIGLTRIKEFPNCRCHCGEPHPADMHVMAHDFLEVWTPKRTILKAIGETFKCTICAQKSGTDAKSTQHNDNDHGLGEWRDHPDNASFTDNPVTAQYVEFERPWGQIKPGLIPLPRCYFFPSQFSRNGEPPLESVDKLTCGMWRYSRKHDDLGLVASLAKAVKLSKKACRPRKRKPWVYPGLTMPNPPSDPSGSTHVEGDVDSHE